MERIPRRGIGGVLAKAERDTECLDRVLNELLCAFAGPGDYAGGDRRARAFECSERTPNSAAIRPWLGDLG
ncbi:hypothetical protein GCM10009765_80240 [Fodinicola feengrottensis]|uniref:Uncharacterized protein n=1 Tax=Fodinicola feengrottensis TaxID=435914 RepID=A0ABN2J812_9ACTN